MSTTLSTTQMIALLQLKTGLGLSSPFCLDRLNEAFRLINQSGEGGLVWQLKQTTIVVPPGAITAIALPADFDPGKTAILRGTVSTGTLTEIPYMKWSDFVGQEHFQTTQADFFACWTYQTTFTPPTSYTYSMKLGPATAFPSAGQSLPFTYHAVSLPPVASGAGNYFPTPDQFDSMIVDLARAEIEGIYRMTPSGAGPQAMKAVMQIIDTYRSDRANLAGLSDQMAQAQEAQIEASK